MRKGKEKNCMRSNQVGIKQQKLAGKCFGVLALLAESENFDLSNLRQETKYARTQEVFSTSQGTFQSYCSWFTLNTPQFFNKVYMYIVYSLGKITLDIGFRSDGANFHSF